jgi:hypothetical protein
VSPVRHAATPRSALYRIGHLPDPLTWPPVELTGGGRFDDPRREFRVLYAGGRRACFFETLAPFRPSVEALAAMRGVTGTDEMLPQAIVPADWYQKRAVARLRLLPGQRWLDLRATQTHETLRTELASILLALGVRDLDLSEVLSRERRLTQAISRWAYDRGYGGIIYRSRFAAATSLWAIFEGARLEPAGVAEPILPDDPDLVAAARVFGLAI